MCEWKLVFSNSIGKCHRKPTAFRATTCIRTLIDSCFRAALCAGILLEPAQITLLHLTCKCPLARNDLQRLPLEGSTSVRLVVLSPQFHSHFPLVFFFRKCRGAYTINFTSFFVTQQRCAVCCMSRELFPLCSLTSRKYFYDRTVQNGSDDQSLDVCRTSETCHKRGMGRGGTYSPSGWVMESSLSVSRNCAPRYCQDEPTTRGSRTGPHPQEAQSRNQKPYQAQHSQRHGYRGWQSTGSKNTTTLIIAYFPTPP